MSAPRTINDRETCDIIARRISILLSNGEYAWAFRSLTAGVRELCSGVHPRYGCDSPLASILEERHAAVLERDFDALWVSDLRGIHPEDVAEREGVGPKSVAAITEALGDFGIPFPLPKEFEFVRPIQRHVTEDEKIDMVEAVLTSDRSDLEEIDRRICGLKAQVAELTNARQAIAVIVERRATA